MEPEGVFAAEAGRAMPAPLPSMRRRFRVLHLLATLERGGTEELVLLLAQEQRLLGCQVEVAVLAAAAPHAAAFQRAGLRVHHLRLGGKVSPGALWRLRRLLTGGRYDILHTHLDLADLYGPLAAWRVPGLLVVSTRHNTDPWRCRPGWKRRPFLIWERVAHRGVAAAIAVSGAVRDFLVREEGLEAHRFVIIPNGIDLAPYRVLPGREAARQSLLKCLEGSGPREAVPGGADGRRTVIGFVGRLSTQKGLDVLLEALASTAGGMDLVLVGEGPQREALERRAARPDLAGHVFFAGHVHPVAPLLEAFDLFAFPSRWEGFGLAVAEAMAASRPVVATRVDGLVDLVCEGKTGLLVPPEDPVALKEALERLVAHPVQARRLGEAGRQRAMRLFGADAMARRVVELYGRVKGGGVACAPPEVLRLAGEQIRSMWEGVLPVRLLRQEPELFLRQQSWEYACVAEHLEMHAGFLGKRLLDLGCGLGTMLLQARSRGATVLGIEPDAASLKLCRTRLALQAGPPGGVLAAVGEALPLAAGSVDMVTCCSVLEHVKQPSAVLEEVRRVLRPGGWLYLGVPNALRFQERHYKVFLPPGTPRWLARAWLRCRGRNPRFLSSTHEMTPGRVEALLRQAGFQVVDSPLDRRLRRLNETLAGQGQPESRAGRMAVYLARVSRTGGLLRWLVRRGFFVTGAVVARVPEAASDS